MSLSSWLRNWKRSAPAARRRTATFTRRWASFRPRVQSLEDRCLLSGYQQINLVGYEPGLARSTDPNLNGWGMTYYPPNGSFCVANAFTTGLATFYDHTGHVLSQTITVPWSAAGSAALGLPQTGHPTGVVYNSTDDFVISANGKSAPARLIFDSIDGTISGWNPDVDRTHAILIRDTFANGSPSVYTGLEIGHNSQGRSVLYATDFLNNHVEMIDSTFTTIGAFTDASVPGFADGSFSAWSVQAVNDQLYVTYASLKDFDGGVVDVFDKDGNLLTPNHFAANAPGAGPLANPWGITQAPANFGAYSNDVLIGNVAGAGNINAFDPTTGAYLGHLQQPGGAPIAITGLWDVEFGDGTPHGGKTNELFFDAGPNAPGVSINGLFGVIHAAGDQHGSSDNHAVPPTAVPAGALTVNGSVPGASSNLGLGMSSSLPSLSTQQSQAIEGLSLVSNATTMAPASSPPAMEQQIDAFFSTLDAMLAPQESRLTMMDPQLSIFNSMFHADFGAQNR